MDSTQFILVLTMAFLWAYVRYFYFVKRSENTYFFEISNEEFNQYAQVFENQLPYFKKLSSHGKNKFIEKSIELRENIEIQTREGLVYTPEMGIFISGCLAQLTFGFKSSEIGMLKGIVLFPDIFYSKLVENWVKGLAMGNGVVFLSWTHFLEGYKDSKDTYNLGLHEFTHILHIQVFQDGKLDAKFSNYFNEFNEVAFSSFTKHRNGVEHFFRPYGSTNEAEFFAVCVENFFEIPELFEAELPTLYYHLCYLLNQNPLNYLEDYTFDREDVIRANEEVEKAIPEFEHVFGINEKLFWDKCTTLIQILFAALMFVFSVKLSDQMLQFFYVFSTISIVLLLVRFLYYNSSQSILNKGYLKHLALRVIPIIGIISFVFNFFNS